MIELLRIRMARWSGVLVPGARRRAAIVSLVMIVGLVLLALVGGLASLSVQQTRQRARYETYKDEFAACEVAINKAYAQVQFMINFGTPSFTNQIQSITAPTLDNFTFSQFLITQIFAGNEMVTTGQWTGLTLYRMRYRIDVTVKKTGGTADRYDHPGVSLRQNLEITYIPLFLYAIFYDPLMEIAPGPFMTVNGLVHANNNAYFQSGGGLNFLKNVTSAGHVFHGRAPGSGQAVSNADVQFSKDATLSSMQRADADGWLTGSDTDWSAAATERWGGGLRDEAHGINTLSLPIPNTVDPHAIIERADPATDNYALQQEKFEYKAGLKILKGTDGVVRGYDANGSPVALTYPNPSNPSQTKSIVSTTSFYDAREAKTVTTIDVNLGNMVESGIKPANGVLYVSNLDSGSNPGVVRLTNGAQLPASTVTGGFTVATNNPLYIKGDYNTANKTLAMVAGDALSILSNAWNDANSNNFGNRNANATTVNAVCMNGIVPSGNDHYSGGVENYFRFLENWNGVNYTFSGSIINMWQSQTANGYWSYGSPIYNAPNRVWSWDTGLGGLNGPPGAPRVVSLAKTAWELPATN